MLKLKVGFSRNIRVEPLIEGMVKPKNIELQFVLCNPGELFYRNLKYDEFDMFEMSFSEYLMTKEKGDGKRWRWNGLPVFLSKAFMWLNLLNKRRQGLKGQAHRCSGLSDDCSALDEKSI